MPRLADELYVAAEAIAGACASGTDPGVYCVGSFGYFVNFSAQQYRALNLIWALDALGNIPKSLPVAIIGGGLSGVTAAAALVHLGYRVDLFEAQKELMAHQLTTDHRLVHPSINAWPFVPLQPATDLPFLNWVSGPCSKVIHGILTEIEKLQSTQPSRFAIRRNRRIIDISKGINGYLLKTTRAPIDTAYGVVILTVGLGDERQHKDFKAVSYWYPDGLERDALIGEVEDFIVSGCGDGGLIDALRLLHRDFDKGGLIFETANSLEGTAVALKIMEAELNGGEAADLQKAYIEAARLIEGTPAFASVHAALERSIGQCRPRLILSARAGGNPFVSRAAPIHKLMLAHAMILNKVLYFQAELLKNEDMLTLGRKEFPISDKCKIIVRHGPVGPPFAKLLDDETVKALYKSQLAIEPEMTRAAWSGAYPACAPEAVEARAQRMHRQALRAIRLVDPYALVMVAPHGYTVVIGNADEASKIPPDLFGIEVRKVVLPDMGNAGVPKGLQRRKKNMDEK